MFSTDQKDMKICSLNPRPEFHGEESVLAADIKVQFSAENTVLDEIDPALRPLLFKKGQIEDADLADQGMPEDYLTELTCKSLPKQFTLNWIGQGYRVVIHRGFTGKEDIPLITCKLDKLKITPKEGGTVDIELMIHCHPSPEELASISELLQVNADVTLEPPSAEQAAQMEIDAIKEEIGSEAETQEPDDSEFEWPKAEPPTSETTSEGIFQ